MRAFFSGYFRPTSDDFKKIWENCFFAVDANVLLNLYRYSPVARDSLLNSLKSIQPRLFIPHQAAKEFLKNRLSVTANQAEEYTRAIRQIQELVENLSNRKKHPFLPDADLPIFREHAEAVCRKLGEQKEHVVRRFTQDDILDKLDALFTDGTGSAFDEAKLKVIEAEGKLRYEAEIPPGYKDLKKDRTGDASRKFGDLIVWKQILDKSKSGATSCIFVTDDQKEDWWLEQSGRTIGPRPELIEEFKLETGCDFWMYSVDKFLEEISKLEKVDVSQEVINEVIQVREDVREESEVAEVSEEFAKKEHKMNAEFMKPLIPSAALGEIVGYKPIPRTEVISKLWAYIKKNSLQDSVNKRIIRADEKLLAIFEKPEVSMFEMTGLVAKHLSKGRERIQ